MPWEAGILPHQHIPKGTTGSAAPAACSSQLNDGKHLNVGRRRAHNTFLVLLHDRGRRRSNFHGEAIGSPEGVAVSDDESPRLPVLQQGNGCRREWQSSEMASLPTPFSHVSKTNLCITNSRSRCFVPQTENVDPLHNAGTGTPLPRGRFEEPTSHKPAAEWGLNHHQKKPRQSLFTFTLNPNHKGNSCDPRHIPIPPPCVIYLPCSLEMSGLYQYLEVSCTNLTLARVSGLMSARKGRKEKT